MDKDGDGAIIRRSSTPSSTFSSTGPRIVNQYSKRHKVTDKDDIQEISREKDGEVTTERTITHQTEEEADDELPEDEDRYDGDRKMIAYSPDSGSPTREHHHKIHREGHNDSTHKEREHHRYRNDSADRSSERRRGRDKYKHSDEEGSKRLDTGTWVENHFASGSSLSNSICSDDNSNLIRIITSSSDDAYHVTRINTENNLVESSCSSLVTKKPFLNNELSDRSRDPINQPFAPSPKNDFEDRLNQNSPSTSRHSGSRHRERRQVHTTRSTSPGYREVGIARTETMRSNASSQTAGSPKSQYYMGDYDYDDDRSRRSDYRDKKAQDDFSSVRRHESFHHEAKSSYTPLSGRPDLHRSHSQRSAATESGDYRDQDAYPYGSETVDREYSRRRNHRDHARSPSPGNSKSPSQKYYLGEDPWSRGSSRREDRSHSRSSDLRKEAVTKSYEQNRREHSPDHRHEDDRNKKDLYAWEDHRSRDYYSHSTRLDDEDDDARHDFRERSSRHRPGSVYGDYRLDSYSPPPNKEYGPIYSVSAHSRSEDLEKDPNDPHKQVRRTVSQSKSEDVKTVPIHDGGTKVTVSKEQQKHYRSEMKYGDRGMGSPPPTSPPPTSNYDYDVIDNDSFDRRSRNLENRYSEGRESREDCRMSRTNIGTAHDSTAPLSNRRKEYDIEDDHQNGYEEEYPSYSHYKSAGNRQRNVPMTTSRPDSPDMSSYNKLNSFRDDTINITPDYTSREKYRSDSPDPVLTCPTFTPLRSPLSVKTADETKSGSFSGFQSRFDRNASDDYTRDTSSYKFDNEKDNESGRFNFRSRVNRDDEFSKSSASHEHQFQSEKEDSAVRGLFQGRLEKDSESLESSSSYAKYKSKYQREKEEDSAKEYPFSSGLKQLDKIELNGNVRTNDSLKRKEEKDYKSPLKDDYSEGETLKLYTTYEREKNRERKSSSFLGETEPLKKLGGFSSSYTYEPTSKNQTVTPPPPELPSSRPPFSNPQKTKPVAGIGFSESIVLPDVPPKASDDLFHSQDLDNESIKSDKSRTSTRTFTLEEHNTNSLKKVHLNPTFRRDITPPTRTNKKSVKPISEEILPEPMKQIPKPSTSKRTPVAVPTRPTRSLIHAATVDGSKKASGKASKAPPVAPKRTKGARKPVLVEVRGWDNR